MTTLADRLGLPHTRGARSFVIATLIDTLGSGLFLPFSLLYFNRIVGLPLPTVGLALSVATIISLPMVPISGLLIDRFGAKRVIIFTQLLQAAGFFGYLFVHNVPMLIAMALLDAAGWQSFWPAHFALVAQVSAPSERDRWFGLTATTRSLGLALGGLLASVLIGANEIMGFHFVLIANSLSFLLAAGLLTWGLHVATPPKMTTGPKQGYRVVFRDGPFLVLTGTNVIFVLCNLLLGIGLPIYLANGLHAPLWMIGVLIAVSTILIASLQTIAVRVLEPYRRTRALMFAGSLWAIWCVLLMLSFVVPALLMLPLLLAATGFYAFAELTHDPTSIALATDTAPDATRGRYVAFFQLSWSIAAIVAPGMFTLLFTVHPIFPWLVVAALVLCASLVMLRLEPHLPAHAVRVAPVRTDISQQKGEGLASPDIDYGFEND